MDNQEISGDARRLLVTVWLAMSALALPAMAGDLVVHVVRPDGSRAVDARVIVLETRETRVVDEEGKAVFAELADGAYHVSAGSARFGSVVEEIELAGSATLTLTLDRQAHREQVVVTATRGGRGSAEVIQPVTVLDETELNDRLQSSLGETLSGQAGVHSTYFGPGSSRPVIRGQSGGRVRVLEDGLGVGDASVTSPDHAVAVEAASAMQVEILRGASTLLYGGTAVGGVVNVLDRRIPEYASGDVFGGQLQLRYGSVAEEKTAAVDLNGNSGGFAWHVDAMTRDTEDYDIPGNAVAGDPGSPRGTLPNSAVETDGFAAGGSWVHERGFLGASFKSLDSLYGIPAELEDEEERAGALRGVPMAPVGGIRIDMEQLRYDLRGRVDGEWGAFDGVVFALGVTDYEHAELEDGEVGTRFYNDSYEGRLELTHDSGSASGIVGVQFGNRDLEAVGAEAFLPENETASYALFAIEEIQRGALRYEIGARLESTDVSTPETAATSPICSDPRDRDFTTASGSVGLVWLAGDDHAIGGALSRSARAPAGEELFSCGEHVATLSFEVGDPGLDEETALGLDVNFRRRTGRLTGELSLFFNDYSDYIYETATGTTEPPADPDGLPVFRFTQGDAEIYGFELQGAVELVHDDRHDFDLTFLTDFVRARLDEGGDLPRTPPWRYGIGFEYLGGPWRASLGVTHVDSQNDLAAFETPTDDYILVSAALGYRLIRGAVVQEFSLRGANLTDEEARNHVSRLKDLVPLPGRDISVAYRLIF